MDLAVLFQSTAGPETGRSNFCCAIKRRGGSLFQSTAGPETGRSLAAAAEAACCAAFQSTAGPETGRSVGSDIKGDVMHEFQSTAGPETGRSDHVVTGTHNEE